MSTAAAMLGAASDAGAGPDDGPVLELRQYKIVAGRRDAFIPFFEANFVESQEAGRMRLVGQFRDLDDPDRFVWLRQFPNMAERAHDLDAFYSGPVWQAHRAVANPMLDDNDNVLLLRPASPGLGFGPPSGGRPAPGAPAPAAHLIVAVIAYLWKDPATGFAAVFAERIRPVLEAAGLPVLAAFTPETRPNDFPRLPVRQGEKVLVWFTRVADRTAYARAEARLKASAAWKAVAPVFDDALERTPQTLFLAPTPRSDLR